MLFPMAAYTSRIFMQAIPARVIPNTKALALIHGNTTRWGGDYNSLTRALDLREPLEDFVAAAI